LKDQVESPFVLNATYLPQGRGSIFFDETRMSHRKRRFWILENTGQVKFTLERNQLNQGSRITIAAFTSDARRTDEIYIRYLSCHVTAFLA